MPRFNSLFDISVIIPTYNRSQLLDYSLLSLYKQNIDKDRFEVIVSDDGSTDGTKEIVKKYESLLNLKYVFQEDKGYRPGSARNNGIRVATGHICVFMDSGVLLNVNCLEQHIEFYAGHGSKVAAVGYVFGFERAPDSEQKLRELMDPTNVSDSISKIAKDEMFFDVREAHYVKYKDQIQHLPAPWYYFWTCHVSALRFDLIKADLFDEKYDGKWGVEDNDMAFRLFQQGVRIHLLRSAEAIHHPHDKNKEERRLEGYQNCLYFNSKFNTVETKIFLDHYMNNLEFVDINEICLEMPVAEKSTTSDLAYAENVMVLQQA